MVFFFLCFYLQKTMFKPIICCIIDSSALKESLHRNHSFRGNRAFRPEPRFEFVFHSTVRSFQCTVMIECLILPSYVHIIYITPSIYKHIFVLNNSPCKHFVIVGESDVKFVRIQHKKIQQVSR